MPDIHTKMSYEIKKAGKAVMSGYLENIKINPSEKGIIKITKYEREANPNNLCN